MPELFDVVEVITTIPEENVRAGMQGTIVEKFSDLAYLIEFSNQQGETLELATLITNQFIVVWCNATHAWVPLSEQATAIVANLSNDAAREVLDFARFLAARADQKMTEHNAPTINEKPILA